MASRVSDIGLAGSGGALASVARAGDALTETQSAGLSHARPLSGAARSPLLATHAATPAERRLAFGTILASAVAFAALAPFAKQPLGPMPAFLPAYQAALILNDLVTMVLLLGQFAILRSRALLVLAGAYLFSACMAVAHALSFPGLFLAAGLPGGGAQTTAWIYFLWHAGFPLFVGAYALMRGGASVSERSPGNSRLAIAGGVAAVVALACGLTLLTTAGHGLLPVIMSGNWDAPAKLMVATGTWMLCLAALHMLWARRPHSVLDLWLMVVMCAWLFDIALAAVLNGGRYDLGWYAGRIYGLVAASLVLVVLLLDNAKLYARLARAEARHVERLRILHEIDRAVGAEETVETIAGAAIQPLRELLGVPRAIVNRFDLGPGLVEWIAAAGRRRTHVGPGVRFPLGLMGDVEALFRGEAQLIDVGGLPDGPDSEALLASDVRYYLVVPMLAGDQLFGALSFGGPRADFSDDQVAIAREVAAQLAIAIAQARLLEKVRAHASELEERVLERTAELEATNKELESFSYSVSHDLRAPLRAVDGYARMLEEDHAARLDEEGRRLLGVVRSSSLRMGQLIDDLLAFSRLGRQQPARRPLDMAQLAREVAGELGPGGERVQVGALPAANADPALIRQVWSNLIGNALKYSGKRSDSRVEVGGQEDPEESVYWVRDNGVGFDPRYAAKLFGVFQRLHKAEEFPGTGVGLAIVQRVVTRHGGRVWAESKLGEGACFYFSLPREGA
jgi:signal transduction histidine kinase